MPSATVAAMATVLVTAMATAMAIVIVAAKAMATALGIQGFWKGLSMGRGNRRGGSNGREKGQQQDGESKLSRVRLLTSMFMAIGYPTQHFALKLFAGLVPRHTLSTTGGSTMTWYHVSPIYSRCPCCHARRLGVSSGTSSLWGKPTAACRNVRGTSGRLAMCYINVGYCSFRATSD